MYDKFILNMFIILQHFDAMTMKSMNIVDL